MVSAWVSMYGRDGSTVWHTRAIGKRVQSSRMCGFTLASASSKGHAMGYESVDVTRMGIRAIIATLLLAAWPAVSLHAEGDRPSVAVYYPGLPWHLRYELQGVVEEYNNHKPGVSTYTMARSETSGILVSTQISPAKEAKTARDCRDAEHKHIREHKAFAGAQIRPSEGSDVDLEVLVPLGSGGVVSYHVHRFWLRDGVCAKVHASKTPFQESDRAGFDALLSSVRFDPTAAAVERAFLIPDRGTLLMTVPALWGFRTSKPDPAMPLRNVTFMEPAGDYRLMLTFFPDVEKLLKGDPTTRAFMETARKTVREKAVEPDPPLLPIKGTAGEGLYFLVTDKELVGKPDQPENWKYLRQGALRIDRTLLFFSMFSHAKESPVVDDALRAISEARRLPSK